MKSVGKERSLITHYLELEDGSLVQIGHKKAIKLGLIKEDKNV